MASVVHCYICLLICYWEYLTCVVGQKDLCRFGDTPDCVFACLCTNGCDRTTGDCINGGACKWDDPSAAGIRRSGQGCRIGNIARGKPTAQTGQWANSHSGLAVDGIITTNIRQCAHPSAGSGNIAWWYVDLQDSYTVGSVTVFNRVGSPERTGNFRLGVGNTPNGDNNGLCTNYNDIVPAGGHDTIQCNSPVTGRYVTIIRNAGSFEPQFIGLCEVMVHGYKPIVCSGRCLTRCDPLVGCDKCTPGYRYPDCEAACDIRRYGDNCAGQCSVYCQGYNGNSRSCNNSQGNCINGCTRGYWGDKCDKQCNDNCKSTLQSEVCLQGNGRCAQGCNDSYFGEQCEFTCSGGCKVNKGSNTCDRDTGSCSNQSDLTAPVVGSVVGFLAVAVLLAILIVAILRRKRNRACAEDGDEGAFENTISYASMKESSSQIDGLGEKGAENPELGTNEPDNLYYDFPLTKTLGAGTCIKMDDLEVYIGANKYTDKGLKKEYEDIPRGELKRSDIGGKVQNIDKNRFKNVKAYDCTRVALETKEEDDISDYINANFITGYPNMEHFYIATQGPKPETTLTFWLMIWQVKANRIVMATQVIELQKTKCAQYWPTKVGEVMTFGNITVTTTTCDSYADYNLTTITLQKDAEQKTIKHLQFLSWPDKHVPDHAFTLLAFRRKVRSFDKDGTGPIVVHCSAGVGRTGTFIALDCLLDQMKIERQIDVATLVRRLRHERMNMVQTLVII